MSDMEEFDKQWRQLSENGLKFWNELGRLSGPDFVPTNKGSDFSRLLDTVAFMILTAKEQK